MSEAQPKWAHCVTQCQALNTRVRWS